MKKKLKIKKYDWGGQWNNSTTPTYTSAPAVNNQWTNASYLPSNMQEDTTNLFGSSPSSTNTGKGFSASQASGYAGAAAGILRNIAPGATGYQSQSGGAKGIDTVKEIAKQIPFVGGFVQAGDAAGDLLQSGINQAEKTGNKGGAEVAAFTQGFLDPMVEHSKTWDLWKKKKLSTGQAIGHTLLNFLGGAGISSAIYQRKYAKDLNPQLAAQQKALEAENLARRQMAKGGTYNGGPVQLEKDETLLRQLPNGGTIVERYNLPTHEQSGNIPNTYMNKPDYAATPNFGYNKYGQITLNPKEVKMTFADKTKKVENRFKRNHADPIADKTKEMALNQIKQDNEILKSALEQAQTSKMMYGGSIPKAKKGLSGLGLTAGDYIQLAGTLPALGYNLARSFEKPEVERFGRDLTPIREQVLAKDYNPLIMAQNAGMATLNDSTNAASRNANLISLISNVAGEKAKYSLATDAQNAALARQRDQLLSGQRQANIGIGIQEKDVNARNRAAQRGFGAKAASQFGQSLTEVGKSLNTNKLNNVKYNSLNSLTGSYTVNPDGSITFNKKRKGGYYGSY